MTPWIQSKTQGKRVLRRWHISGAPLLRYWHPPGAPLITILDSCGDTLKCSALVLGTVRGTFTLTTPSQQRNAVVQFHTKPKSRMKIHGGPGGIVQFKLSHREVHVFIQTHNTIACSAAVIFTEGLLMGSVQNTNAPATPSDQQQTIMEVHAKSESVENIVVQGES